MVVDQFGMIGLLTFIRAAETDPNLVSLALGADLTTLGLNLNSEVNLFPTFGGPWAETPCRPQDIDFHVPHEYLTNTAIRSVELTAGRGVTVRLFQGEVGACQAQQIQR